MIRHLLPYALVTMLASLAVAGFAPEARAAGDAYVVPYAKKVKSKKQLAAMKRVILNINKRNLTLEDSQDWLVESYKGLNLRRLNNIQPAEYKKYREFLHSGRLYILVHPAYYTFFTKRNWVNKSRYRPRKLPSENLVEALNNKSSFFNDSLKVMKAQEKVLQNFLELISTSKKLVILVVPRDYKQHTTYGMVNGFDEYTRFLNEVTNGSESVIYMESQTHDRGDITPSDLKKLREFLAAIDVKRIYLGGGYVGRCLEAYYGSLYYGLDDIPGYDSPGLYLVPELTAVAPMDLDSRWMRKLLFDDGSLNFEQAARNLKVEKAYGIQKAVPHLRRFYIYEFYDLNL